MKKLFKHLKPIIAWALAGLIALITGWIGDGVEGNTLFFAKEDYEPIKWCVIIVLFLLWILFAWLLEKLLRYLLPLRTLSVLNQARPHAVLIAPVSGSALVIDTREGQYWLVEKKADGNVVESQITDDLEKLLTVFANANIAPLLRTLICHRPMLRQVWLLDSKSKAAWMNHEFADDLAKALTACLPGVKVEVHGSKPDFEDVDEVYSALDEIVEATLRAGSEERDIIVDLTGGQKPTSVALALYTLHRDIRCQYVQTGGDKKVLQYDMAFQPAKRD